ncbi:MAG: T9SS type A sorting domain-containing protein [Bacteroidetes bacterium]|nr:T9SS type A sorting domain-containing protein [Bacteroidota bacterium]
MNKPLLIFFYCLLFIVHSSYAQKIRFTDTSNRWRVCYDSWGNGSHPMYGDSYFIGDTIIKGKSYKIKFFNEFYREDTVLRKVYMYRDSIEYVYLDYNLKIGDTIQVYDKYISQTYMAYVNMVDSVQIDSVWHTMWLFNQNIVLYANNYVVIEGIGEFKHTYFENGWWLTCFKNKGSIIEIKYFPQNLYLNATTCALSVNTTPKLNKSISIIPNPANESSRIVFPNAIQSGSVVITNMLGQVVMQKEIMNKDEVQIGRLNNEGVYFYKVFDKTNNQTYTGKFVYE